LQSLQIGFTDDLTFIIPQPPEWFTEAQKIHCMPYIAQHFIQTLENYEKAQTKNNQVLSYTRFSTLLEKFDKLPKQDESIQSCHDALSLRIDTWLQGKTSIDLGKPYDEMKEEFYPSLE